MPEGADHRRRVETHALRSVAGRQSITISTGCVLLSTRSELLWKLRNHDHGFTDFDRFCEVFLCFALCLRSTQGHCRPHRQRPLKKCWGSQRGIQGVAHHPPESATGRPALENMSRSIYGAVMMRTLHDRIVFSPLDGTFHNYG